MATRIVMPQLGESVVEGIIIRWLKAEGEWVARDEPLVEIMTDKVNAEIPSPVAGVLRKITAPEGATVAVGVELAVIEEAARAEEAAVRPAPPGPPMAEEEEAAEGAEKKRSSPLVRRLAREYGVDLSQVKGTGLGGRITKEDVMHFLAQREVAPPPAPPAELAAPPEEEVLTPSPMRRIIAEHMLRSVRTAPHAWTMVEADVTALVAYRESIRDDFQRREGIELTHLPFFIRAVVEALQEHPLLNSTWAEDKIIVKKRINIGVAVALDEGLIVPVIHDADRKSIAGLARTVSDLATRARAGKLTLADVQGGTFTVNNPGAFGSVMSVPIIHQPQAGIITMEAITKRPVVINDAIAIRSMVNLCLSFDHRITDGATAGRFLQSVKRRLEAFGPATPLY